VESFIKIHFLSPQTAHAYLRRFFLTLLQKLVKHKGHEGTQRKISSFSTVVYFVSFVVKGLFAVDSFL